MLRKATFGLITCFWLVMNALLWHSEFGPGNDLAAGVPVQLVWEKILTAPDDSNLSIMMGKRKVGYLRWRPNVGEEVATGKIANENEPEGIVTKLTKYRIDIEGNFIFETLKKPVRFNANWVFTSEQKWQSFAGHASLRPLQWRVKANAEERMIFLESDDGESEWIKRLSFDDLRNPAKLAQELELPPLPLFNQPLPSTPPPAGGLPGIQWEARHEWMSFGRNRVRIYQLTGKLLGRHQVTVLVTRVGEIIRIDFPAEFQLVNDALFGA